MILFKFLVKGRIHKLHWGRTCVRSAYEDITSPNSSKDVYEDFQSFSSSSASLEAINRRSCSNHGRSSGVSS